jgi:hypothetical protein
MRVTERSSSFMITTEERVGKLNKQGVGCDAFMRALSPVHRADLERWLVPYEPEPLADVLARLPEEDAREKLRQAGQPDGVVYWMPNLIRELKGRSRCAGASAWGHLCNEVKSIDLKVTTQDLRQLKARPPVYKYCGVMVDDLNVSLAHIDSIYMKHVFNRSEKGQASLVKMFLMDLIRVPDGRIKAVHNTALGLQIFSELHALASALAAGGMPVMYKYSILILRNADAYVIKLIDVEDDPVRACGAQQLQALATMLGFWRRALKKDVSLLRLDHDEEDDGDYEDGWDGGHGQSGHGGHHW